MASAHAKISYIKSAVRLLGYLFLGCVSHHPVVTLAAILLGIAEIIGIVEEVGY